MDSCDCIWDVAKKDFTQNMIKEKPTSWKNDAAIKIINLVVNESKFVHHRSPSRELRERDVHVLRMRSRMQGRQLLHGNKRPR
jgi:hypothetical protein